MAYKPLKGLLSSKEAELEEDDEQLRQIETARSVSPISTPPVEFGKVLHLPSARGPRAEHVVDLTAIEPQHDSIKAIRLGDCVARKIRPHERGVVECLVYAEDDKAVLSEVYVRFLNKPALPYDPDDLLLVRAQ